MFKIKNHEPILASDSFTNLMIIVLFMVLVRYYLIAIPLAMQALICPNLLFILPCSPFVMVLLSAAGYIINEIILIWMWMALTKPTDRLPAKSSLPKASGVLLIINLTALLIGFYLSLAVESLQLALIFVMISGMLWFYSARYKRMLLLVMLIIALGAALGVVIVWFFELKGLIPTN